MDYEYFFSCLRFHRDAYNNYNDEDDKDDSIYEIIKLLKTADIDVKNNEIDLDILSLKQSVNTSEFIEKLHDFYKKVYGESFIMKNNLIIDKDLEFLEFSIPGLFIGCHDSELIKYVKLFLTRLPNDAYNFFIYEIDLLIIQPQVNTIDRYIIDNGTKEIKFVLFVTDLCKSSKDEIIYTIAHEFAHLYLGHDGVNKSALDGSQEIKADQLVEEWGFGNEMKNSSWSYLYGKNLLKNMKS